MIDLNTYKLMHLIGVFGLFLGLGAACVTDRSQSRWAAPLHGIGMLLILVAGFGMLARLGIHSSLPVWVLAKLLIWLILGGSIAAARRKPLPAFIMAIIWIVLGGAAAMLALYKPF